MNEISLCMIVKNEADNIRKSLESVAGLLDDIVVVDTGSTDATKAIAAEYTQAVFDFAWSDDFSQVRNFASSKARHDWILVLDADEVVTEFDVEGVCSLIRQYRDCVGAIRRMNCFEAQGGLTTAVESISRLFDRTVFQYTGSIHEQLTRRDSGEAGIRFPVPIAVDHSGYRPEELTRKGTIERNRRLLLTELEKNPLDPYWHYQAGKTYSLAKEFDQAC